MQVIFSLKLYALQSNISCFKTKRFLFFHMDSRFTFPLLIRYLSPSGSIVLLIFSVFSSFLDILLDLRFLECLWTSHVTLLFQVKNLMLRHYSFSSALMIHHWAKNKHRNTITNLNFFWRSMMIFWIAN